MEGAGTVCGRGFLEGIGETYKRDKTEVLGKSTFLVHGKRKRSTCAIKGE